MPSNFSKYTSGIVAPTGISEAAGNAARMTQQGLLTLGAGLAEGLDEYGKGISQFEVIKGHADVLHKNLSEYYQMVKDDPEYSGIAGGLQEQMDVLKDIPSMNRNKAAGALVGVQSAFNTFDKHIALVDHFKQVALMRNMTTGINGIPDKEKSTSPASIKAGDVPWVAGDTAVQNGERFRSQLNRAVDGGAEIDEKEAWRNWHDAKEREINASTKLTPDQKSRALESLASHRTVTENRFLNQENDGTKPNIFDPDSEDFAQFDIGLGSGTYRIPSQEPVIVKADGTVVSATPSRASALMGTATPATPSAPVKPSAPVTTYVMRNGVLVPLTANNQYEAPLSLPAPDSTTAPSTATPFVLPSPDTTQAPSKSAIVTKPSNVVTPDATAGKLPVNPVITKEEVSAQFGLELPKENTAPVVVPQKVQPAVVAVPEAIKQQATPEKKSSIVNNIVSSIFGTEKKPEKVEPEALKAYKAARAAEDALPFEFGREDTDNAVKNGANLQTDGTIAYELKEGDTPQKIAKRFGYPLQNVQQMFKNSDAKKAGDYLELGHSNTEAPISPEEAGYNPSSDNTSDTSTPESAPAGLPAPADKPATTAKPVENTFTNEDKIKQTAIDEEKKKRFKTNFQNSVGYEQAGKYYQRIIDDVTSDESLRTGKADSVDANAWTRFSRMNPAVGHSSVTAVEALLAADTAVAAGTLVAGGIAGATGAGTAVFGIKGAKEYAAILQKTYKPLLEEAAKAYPKGIPDAVKRKIMGTAVKAVRESIAKTELTVGASRVRAAGGVIAASAFDKLVFGDESWDAPASTIYGNAEVENHIQKTVDEIAKIRDYGLGINPDKLTGEQRYKIAQYANERLKDVKVQMQNATQNYKDAANKPKTFEQVIGQTATGEVDPRNLNYGDRASRTVESENKLINVGSIDVERDLTAAEKKQRLQDYMMNKYKDDSGKGYLPSGFDAMYKALVPESSLKIINTAIGPMYNDGTHWKQAEMPKQQSLQDIRKETIGLFGRRMPDGSLAPVELGEDTGVHIAGLFSGGDEALAKYKDQISELASGRAAIKSLDEILGKFGHSVSPELLGQSKIHMATLRAATRIEVIGVGTVSETEQKMLDAANPNTTSMFRLDSLDRSILNTLKGKLERKMKMISGINGIGIKIVDRSKTDTERNLRLSK